MTQFPNHPNHRILIVDDERHILQVLSLKLRNAGYEVVAAEDGEEAMEIVFRDGPDLVITDFQMPYMTGLELCQAMAVDDRSKNIPVIMLTARGYSLDDGDLRTGNIRHVIHKPFSPRAILDQVNAMLQPVDPSADEQRRRSVHAEKVGQPPDGCRRPCARRGCCSSRATRTGTSSGRSTPPVIASRNGWGMRSRSSSR